MVAKVERSGSGKPAAARMAAAMSMARVGRVAAVLALAALAAGCSSSSSSSTSSSGTSSPATTVTVTATATSSSTSTAGAAAACATSALRISQSAPNGYAGGVIVTLGFTNASGATCTLYGYPGVSLVSAPRSTQIGLAAKRSGTAAVKLIALGPGATASASLQIVDALNFPSTTCDPVKAAYLRVYPPNQTVSVLLANTSQTCSKPVQTLTVNPVQAGSGSSSTARPGPRAWRRPSARGNRAGDDPGSVTGMTNLARAPG